MSYQNTPGLDGRFVLSRERGQILTQTEDPQQQKLALSAQKEIKPFFSCHSGLPLKWSLQMNQSSRYSYKSSQQQFLQGCICCLGFQCVYQLYHGYQQKHWKTKITCFYSSLSPQTTALHTSAKCCMPRSCVHSGRCTCKTDTLEKVTTEPDTRKCNKCTHASSRRLYLLCLVMDISYLVLSTRAYRRILGKRQDAKGSTKSQRPSPFT